MTRNAFVYLSQQLWLSCYVPLNRGRIEEKAMIDWQDSDLLEFNWTIKRRGGNKPYAVRFIGRSSEPRQVNMHRIILERILNRSLNRDEFVDHINGDSLDNRRFNLRLATRKQNQQNRGKGSHNTSGYKGAFWHKRNKRWMAIIRANGKVVNLGSFDTAEEAHQAYCKAAEELHGEFANFG